MNERITENIVRKKLDELAYYAQDNHIYVEEQKSQIQEVTKLLKGASKTGGKGSGYPEFIISSSEHPDFIIVVECKPDIKKHESESRDNAKDYAVDGVIHYASFLKKTYNVIAIAVSGQKKSNLKTDIFLWPKEANSYKVLTNKHGVEIKDIVSFEDFIEHGTFDPEVADRRHKDLMGFARELHAFMRDHAKLTESEKPLLVSGTLIALKNTPFAKSFDIYEAKDLQEQWLSVIQKEIERANIPLEKTLNMTQPYSSIAVHPELGRSTKEYPKGILNELIKQINEKVYPFISYYHDYDVVGQFYGEFLKYTGGDKKGLGIVLTPRHITELFSLIANLNTNSKVLDICTGTGGFLISAMHSMIKKSKTHAEIEKIKKENLVGVEQQPNMFALAASNMILRGDGKANLYQGSCFDAAITKEIKNRECNIGMINPPYSQSSGDLHELAFINHMLNCLTVGGMGIAIVPMSCAIAPHSMKEELLNNHTLEAVMSMPDNLFYPVGTVTCIMVFRARIPHEVENKSTWFGYWKNDGFELMRHQGRIDQYGRWESIRDKWVRMFRNREVHAGESVMKQVTAQDEWCAEAYMETDYSLLTKEDFEQAVKNYAIFKIANIEENYDEID